MTRDENERLRALESFAVLDTPPERRFDDLTALAAELCNTPISLVSLVDADRQWFKSRVGVEAISTSHAESFCAHVLDSKQLVVIPDARQDPRVADYSCVRGEPHFRFYAGAPLTTDDGHVLGTLCVADMQPRDLDDTQRRRLTVLAAQVMAQLEVRRQAIELEAALRDVRANKRMLEAVLNNTDVLIYAKDLEGRFVMVNPAVHEATRIADDMIGRTVDDFFDADIAAAYWRNDQLVLDTGQQHIFTERMQRSEGAPRVYQSAKFPIYDDAGNIMGTAGVSTDVTELEAERAAHENAESRLRMLLDELPVAVAVVDQAGVIAYANPATVELCGAPNLGSLQGRSAIELVRDTQRSTVATAFSDLIKYSSAPSLSGQSILLRDDGIEIHIEYTINRITYGNAIAVQIQARDITAALIDRDNLQRIANTDSLTGIMNRRAWTARLKILADNRSTARELVIAMIDIDHFKTFNDSLGHLAGDRLLRDIALRIVANVDDGDIVARWGGEEFVVALSVDNTTEAVSVLERLRGAMPPEQTCSIGYTTWRHDDTPDACIARADRAMYAAKSAGRNRVVAYSLGACAGSAGTA